MRKVSWDWLIIGCILTVAASFALDAADERGDMSAVALLAAGFICAAFGIVIWRRSRKYTEALQLFITLVAVFAAYDLLDNAGLADFPRGAISAFVGVLAYLFSMGLVRLSQRYQNHYN